MKKTFKFFMCAAIVAAGFVGCSDEVVNPGKETPNPGPTDPSGIVEGEGTYATFVFNDTKTKSLISDGIETGSTTTVDSFRVVIFRTTTGGTVPANSTPEIDTLVNNSSQKATIFLKSGSKKIFVVANPNNQLGTSSQTYGTFLDNYVTTGLDMANVSRVLNGSLNHFLMSNGLNSCDFQLAPGVSIPDSQDSDPDKNKGNNITIDVKRALAKLMVSQTGGGTNNQVITQDGKGNVVNASYRMWNINKDIYTVQRFRSNNTVYSPNADAALALFPSIYGRGIGQGSSNDFITVKAKPATAPNDGSGDYYYVTENVPTSLLVGNVTFAAIKATFYPTSGNYVSAVNAFNNATSAFGIVAGTSNITTATTFWRLDSIALDGLNNLYQNVEKDMLFTVENEMKRIVFHFENKAHPTLAGATEIATVTDAQIEKYFTKYTQGTTYYRLDIGETNSMNSVTFGVERNNTYWANIQGYAGLGVNTEDKLIENPGKELEGDTNITVTINVLDWDLKPTDVIVQ